MNDVRPRNVRGNLVKESRKIYWLISIELIAIVIGVLIICLFLIIPHYLAPMLREERIREPPFEINAVSHEITNLSDMYTGFEFDNSTFTVKVDITNDTVTIRGIQQEYRSYLSLKVNNTTINPRLTCSGSDWPEIRYVVWIINVYYGDNMTFSFSGKGRADCR